MMKLFRNLVLITLLIAAGIFTVNLPPGPDNASALSGSQFQAGRIIDDSVFFRANTLNVQDIQSFLNAKVPVCDSNGTKLIFDSTHGDTVTRAVYSQRRGVSTPFTCLKDYSQATPNRGAESGLCTAYTGGTKSAAQIIFDVAHSCGINPQVFLVLLQKEQSLITDDWPWPVQYRSATGYGCPDTAPCDEQYYGFFNQIYNAGRQFKRYARDAHLFNYRSNSTSFILYNPNTACGGSNVHIQNQATANLYNYTPYQPNQAALNNLYGTGDGCSAYGNRNFWRLFNDWFGATTGPDYAWSIENFFYSGGDNHIALGQTETLTLKARNIGRVPWYNHGNNPIKLGTWEPANRHSILFQTFRLATLKESVVQPNEVGTFTFTVTPASLGTYVESLNLVAENHTWLSWPGFRPTIHVTSPYSWQVQSVVYDNGTGMMDPGISQWITVKAKNTGSATWLKSGGVPIRLATWAPDRKSKVADGWLSPSRITTFQEESVAPNETATFRFRVRTPGSGRYYEQLNLVAEGQAWFNNTGLTLYLEGRTYAWQPLWHSHSTGTANIPRNTEFTLVVKARNTGTVTWKKHEGYPVRLATVAPLDRGTALFHPATWIKDTRPATHQEDVVPPGHEATFIFKARSPSSLGPRLERFSLVADGITWLNDPGLSIYVNSQ